MPALFPAEIYDKGPGDKTLILVPRTHMVYPFQAPNWTDLRVGFFLSVTDATNDDLINDAGGLMNQTILNGADGMGPQERYWIGVKDRSDILPKNPNTSFVGFSNAGPQDSTQETIGHSRLTPSALNGGTSDLNYWRPNHATTTSGAEPRPGFQRSGGIWQSFHPRFLSTDGVQQYFPRANIGVAGGPAGYATLLALRITRPDKDSKVLTVRVPHYATRHTNILFTNTPTLDILRANLQAFPTTVQQWGPNTVNPVPDALYCYWPFSNSRLRIHAVGILSR
jgi:hypothetical protein